MLHSCAAYLTDGLYRRCKLAPEKRSTFQYGFELILSTSCAIFSIFLISILLKDIFSSFAFLGIFFFLRLCSGGYHAPTYARCFVLTNTVYLLVYFFSRVLIKYELTILATIITLLSGIVIFILTPIRNKNHPISEKVYRKNMVISRILVTLETLVLVTLVILKIQINYLSVPMLSLTAVAVMMIIPKIQERSK